VGAIGLSIPSLGKEILDAFLRLARALAHQQKMNFAPNCGSRKNSANA